jgi:hypothetical protein
MIVSIIQPSFLPWLGYFEQMFCADAFVYLDDVNYTKQDWRNRNRLKSPYGVKYITVPVENGDNGRVFIKDVRISYERNWIGKMLAQIRDWYSKAPYYRRMMPIIGDVINRRYERLVDLIYELNREIMRALRMSVPVYLSSSFKTAEDKNERLVDIVKCLNATVLYDGKSAEHFIDRDAFRKCGCEVVFQNYQHPQYNQLWGPFESHLSVIDLLMNCGDVSMDTIMSSPVPEVIALQKGCL